MRKITQPMLKGALGVLVSAGLSVGPAAAQTHISIQATTIPVGNLLNIAGIGDIGGGVGHGTYQLGSCSYDGFSRSNCVTSGTYVELAGSQNPGSTGTFSWRLTWLGNAPNPIQVRSVSAGSNITTLYSVPTGSFFEVILGNGRYANLDFGAPDTPNPTGGVLNWQAFLSNNATCSGSPATCSVSDVMLAPGSSIQSNISQFNMQLDYAATVVPEPSSVALVGIGLLAIAAQGYRRRSNSRRA